MLSNDMALRKSSLVLEPVVKTVPGLTQALFMFAKVKFISGKANKVLLLAELIICKNKFLEFAFFSRNVCFILREEIDFHKDYFNSKTAVRFIRPTSPLLETQFSSRECKLIRDQGMVTLCEISRINCKHSWPTSNTFSYLPVDLCLHNLPSIIRQFVRIKILTFISKLK